MQEFLQFLTLGLLVGVMYGLIALPLGLVHDAMGIIDAAAGGYAALAGIVAVAVGGAVGFAAGVGAAVVAALIVGLIYQLLYKRGVADPVIVITATFGFGLALESIILTQFGKDPMIARLFTQSWRLGPVFLNPQQVINLVVGAILVAALLAVLYKTSLGRQIRAGAANKVGALLTGISVTRLQYLVFAVEGLLAGIAGILLAYTTGLDFTSVITLALNAFGAAVIFGMRGPLACFLGGIVIGVVESLVGGYISNGVLLTIPYVFVIAVLILMPHSTLSQRP